MSDAILGAWVKTVFTAENGCYGAKRITAELKDQANQSPVNHKRVARIMRSLKLCRLHQETQGHHHCLGQN